MSLTLAPTEAWDDEPAAAFILETTKASFLPLSPLTDVQFESRGDATHMVRASGISRVNWALARCTPTHIIPPAPGLLCRTSTNLPPVATSEYGSRTQTVLRMSTPLSIMPNMQPNALNELLQNIMEIALSQSSLPSPPSHVASMNASVTPTDPQLFPSASPAIPAQMSAYALAPFYHASDPQYVDQRPVIFHRRAMLSSVITHNMWTFQDYSSESTSGSSSPAVSLDPMRHYRDRDSTPVSCLVSPDVPPVAGPSKPEKGKKVRSGRQDRRHNPFLPTRRPYGGSVRAQSRRCSAVGTLKKEGIKELVDKASEAQWTVNASVTFVCQWKGCGLTVKAPELCSHLGTKHKSHLAVACEWGTCTEPLTKGAIVKHLRSGKHLGAVLESLKCEHCSKGFTRRDPLRRHLQGTK
ncbi:hypothetical protein B0H17DRAFT_1190323 [Mycena rosella]|uniref:C2H2-type domain-containing protein n=1 Tax=Mycena rosella TaxID=1033263 RepID=A0AAD7H2U1_MYCRO|nr:hypothetical protein B0H17DRAFT_1190323 [Mycena rosella]